MGRGARDQLDVPAALELGEGAGDVAVDPPVQLPHAIVELLPEACEGDDRSITLLVEVGPGVGARAADIVRVERQLTLELGRRELLGEHR